MKILSAVLVTNLLLTSVCYADEPPKPPPAATVPSSALTPIPPGDDHIKSVKKGEVVPFDGQLFDNDTALRWGNYLEQSRIRLKIDVEMVHRIMAAEVGYRDKVIEYERGKYNRVVPDLEARLAKVTYERDNPPWYKTTWVGIGIGVVGTCAVVGLTAWTLGNVR